jgi:hypothetical protein
MEYKIVLGSKKIICYEDIKTPVQSYYYPLATEQMLINSIKAGS